jgi:hypothetical protein
LFERFRYDPSLDLHFSEGPHINIETIQAGKTPTGRTTGREILGGKDAPHVSIK